MTNQSSLYSVQPMYLLSDSLMKYVSIFSLSLQYRFECSKLFMLLLNLQAITTKCNQNYQI
jgi:hypothetical protein